MKEFHSAGSSAQVQVLARLAALERMRDHAVAAGRASLFRSIQDLIDAEKRALRSMGERDSTAKSPSTGRGADSS